MLVIATSLVGAFIALLSPTVELPSIDVAAAPIVLSGITDEGALDVPTNVSDVGLWQHSAPGENIVLAAHVSLRAQGRGVFYDLKHLQPGETVIVMGRTFVIDSVDTVLKADLDSEAIFTGRGRLILVTCGGAFSGTSFESNVVVIATPEEG